MNSKIKKIIKLKKNRKIICLTSYSKNISEIIDPVVDIVLVGDSLGSVLYDYKSTRGEKALKKEAKRKARLEQRKAKRNLKSKTENVEDKMHDIQKTITLDDLTNPDKN